MPDNLFASIIEEQILFQSLLSSPFRKIFPIFRTENNFESIKIYPPIAIKGYIVRPCNVDFAKTKKKEGAEGFVLGYAGEKDAYLIEEIPHLKEKARLATFDSLISKSWYVAQVEYKKIGNGIVWKIGKKEWHTS